MSPEDFAAARRSLGWSCYELAEALGLSGSRKLAGQKVRQMEHGEWRITGSIARVVEALLSGWRPG